MKTLSTKQVFVNACVRKILKLLNKTLDHVYDFLDKLSQIIYESRTYGVDVEINSNAFFMKIDWVPFAA